MNAAQDGVAIVGMAGRFPGAAGIDEFWRNLVAGSESITRFAPHELSALVPQAQRNHPRYVAARGTIADADRFDAAFFGISPGEATLIDPQQRVFLELCWNALEHAGLDPQRYAGTVGVYAGTSNNSYRKLLDARPDLVAASGEFAAMLASEKDYVATRVAHRIGLTGPAISIYTACSTSLVAVAQAWYALMSWQCDAALAGGINIAVPQESGYLPVDGGMESGDGHCRPFDADASGTVFSSGGGVVVLKRLADALADRDFIWAVIRGVGVNNDGADKASFTAPSVRGQADAIGLALGSAGVSADSIGYVEAHGTGTPLGDPIEVEALARALRGADPGSCWLGSVKSNFGHLVAGSGVAGLIKTALALHHERIPPTLHFRKANPEIDFAATPFRVADRAIEWPRGAQPRRAGVSSFGVGGTNAHVIVEEAPPRAACAAASRLPALLVLSARDDDALRRRGADLAAALDGRRADELADIGWTLASGRRALGARAAVVAGDVVAAQQALRALDARTPLAQPRVVFLFPGQGAQHVDMARELIDSEPVFAVAFGQCCELIAPLLGSDLRALILADADARASASVQLARTRHAQPALFAVEYALAQLWRAWGVEPAAMVGHSIGEYVAACLAGVFTLEEAIRLVVARGIAMDAQPPGAMLAVRAAEAELARRLPRGVEVAAVNAADSVVVAGGGEDIAEFAGQLDSAQIASTRLQVSHAFHSALMNAALPLFRAAFDDVTPAAPSIPFYSCVSGRPITPQEATSPDYWCSQIRAPVRFADAAAHALGDDAAVALEVGPGQALSGLLRRRAELRGRVVASLAAAGKDESDRHQLANAVGQLWCLGVAIDWDRYFDAGARRRVPLPGYPFRGPRYWIDVAAADAAAAAAPRETAAVAAPEPAPAPAPAPAMPVTHAGSALRAGLRELVAALSGDSVRSEHDQVRFLDLGLDSLALTQLALELERRHGVKLRFRRLMEDVDSIDKLAQLIGEETAAPAALARVACRCGADGEAPLLEDPRFEPPPPAAAAKAAPDAPFGAAARITRTAPAGLDPAQARWLREFTARYTRRTAASKAFSERNRAHMADPRVVTGFNPLWKELVYPIVVERSDGAWLHDVDGNRYIDLLNAFGANFLGYQPQVVKRALAAQIEAGFEIGPQHPLSAEVAALIAQMTGMQRVAFCNTGSEAVMGAMRIARTVSGRKTIVIFRDSYHGIFDEVIVRGTPALRSIAAAPGILASAVENILVLDYGSAQALETIRARAGELAAVMIEPVQARNPTLQPRQFVQALREICDAGGCALIFDEVITGFRIAPGGAQEFYGVRADLATYGKVIGGGLPLAAIGGSARWMDALDGGAWQFGDDSRPEAGVTYFAGTFVRHPLALAAAKATLLHLKQCGAEIQRTLNERTAGLIARLNAFFAAQAAPMRAIGFASLWRVRIDDDQPCAELFYYALRERGLHLYAQFNCFLSAAHGAAEVAQIAARVEAATLELLDAGVLRRRGAESAALPSPASEAALGATPVASAGADLPEAVATTDAQIEKWIACQFGDGANVAFNESQLLMLEGELDRAALERAVRHVSARHEACAMAFAADGGVFRVGPLRGITPGFVDLSASGAADLQRHCRAALGRAFDLARAPLLRIELIRLGVQRHALLIVAHHLVFDGWSAAVFLDEVASAYRAFRAGGAPQLPPAESFRRFAQAERDRRTSQAGRTQLQFWKDLYAEGPDALELPLDRARPREADFSADTVFHDFPADLTAALRQYARRHGVTLYATLLAGFGVLLARLSGQNDFAIGIPFASQALAGSRSLLGDGVNTLPLRLRIDAGEDFAALARRCHRALLDAADHQDLTVHTLLGAFEGRRRAALGALTDVIFNLNPRLPALDFAGLRHDVRDCAKVALVKDLFFNLNDRGDRLTLDLHYRTALFDAATMRRWIGHLQTLLGAASGGNANPVLELPLLDGAERDSLPGDGQASERAFAADALLLPLVREQARRSPKRIAYACAGETLTYEALLRRSGAVARLLLARGVGSGHVVGLCVPRSVELPVALLGVLAAGAAYVPLDPDYPQERLRFIVDDAGVRHVLASRRVQIPAHLAARCQLHLIDDSGAAQPPAELPHVAADAPAYVLYTSGSTGTPKGVRVLHRNLANLLLSMRERPGLTGEDVLCAVTPLSFDIAALELYLPLLVGARVLIATDAQRRDPEALTALLREQGATVLQTTPSWLRVLSNGARARRLPRLKLLIGGEELPRDLAERVLPHCAELWNLYGPTETTIWSTACRVGAGQGSVPIGTPIANTRIYLLDARGQPVPPGARGEIWIGGAGVADGYLNQAQLTAERFRPDPFAGAGARMYRTGDIGSWSGGQLYFHGRADDQFKLRGFRIEPGDIEAAACAQDEVSAAVATVHALSADDRRLVLYVVAPGAPQDFARELRQRLRQRLPPHMIPQHVELIDALPQTAHGKVDRKALPEPRSIDFDAAVAAPAAAPAAADPLTMGLLQIWRDLLGVADIDVDSNFFDAGGDSLLGVELFQRAHARTGVNLPLATLLTAQTVREQARLFRAAGAREPGARVVALPRPSATPAQDWSPLVAIHAGGHAPPLFCVHALGGNVLNYVPLARALGDEQPVYGLQAVGIDGLTPPLTTIEAMAQRYLGDIRARFPHGPYYLCGGSMGGLVAFELAQMLAAAGEAVAFLGLFDTYGPDDHGLDSASGGALARLLHGWRDRWARVRSLDRKARRSLFADAIAHRIDRGFDALRAAWHRRRGTPLPHNVRYRELERIHLRADCAYRPRPYHGPVTLFRATRDSPSATLGWESVALGGIQVVDVDAAHDNLIEQPGFALALRAALERARRAQGQAGTARRHGVSA